MLEHRNVSKIKIVSLLTHLGEVPDPRVARTREHDLVELVKRIQEEDWRRAKKLRRLIARKLLTTMSRF